MKRLYIVFDKTPTRYDGGLITTYIDTVSELRDELDIRFLSIFKSEGMLPPELENIPTSTLFNLDIDNRFYKAPSHLSHGSFDSFFKCIWSALAFFLLIPFARLKTAQLLKDSCVIAPAPASGMFISSRIKYILEIHTNFEYFFGDALLGRMQSALMTKPALTVFRNRTDAQKGSRRFPSDYLYNTFRPVKSPDNLLERHRHGVLYVGRLAAQKNPDMLIDAAKAVSQRVPGFHLDIYGDGELAPHLRERINRENLSSVVALRGFTEDKSVYINYDLLWLTSNYEGFGLVIIEGEAYGTPCVSTDWGDASREIVQDGLTGCIAEDFDEFVMKSCELLQNPSALDEMRKRGIEDFKTRFSSDVHKSNWMRILESVYGPDSIG